MLVPQSLSTRHSRELIKFNNCSSLSKSGVPSSSSAVFTSVLLIGLVATATGAIVIGSLGQSRSLMAGTIIGAVNFGTWVLPAGGRRTMFPTAGTRGVVPLPGIRTEQCTGWKCYKPRFNFLGKNEYL